MANVTCMVKKILSDYKKNNLRVNSALKYRFIYNGYETDVFYTTKDGLQNQLVLSILINGVAYLATLHFSKNNDDYHMKYPGIGIRHLQAGQYGDPNHRKALEQKRREV